MKIYIKNLELQNIKENIELIKKYEIKNIKYIIFYTTDGIFELNNKNLYKLYQKDVKITSYDISYNNKDYELLYDNSFYNKEKIYSIPNLYIERKIIKTHYNIAKSFSSFIIEYEDNNIIDFYFELDDKSKDKISNKNTIVVKIGSKAAKRYHFSLLSLSLTFAIIFVVLKFTNPVQLIFLLAYIPLVIHSIFVYKNEDESNLDGELKKVALSTFLFAILFGLGQVL